MSGNYGESLTRAVVDEFMSINTDMAGDHGHMFIAPTAIGWITRRLMESMTPLITAHDVQVRADERERVARAIEIEMRRHDRAQVGFSAIGDTYAHAARIARAVARD